MGGGAVHRGTKPQNVPMQHGVCMSWQMPSPNQRIVQEGAKRRWGAREAVGRVQAVHPERVIKDAPRGEDGRKSAQHVQQFSDVAQRTKRGHSR